MLMLLVSIVKEIVFSVVVFTGMYCMIMTMMHEFGKFINDNSDVVVEDYSKV